jgi:hypothetical protein
MKQVWILLLSALVLTLGAVWWVQRALDPPVESVVASSLEALQEQNRLSAFAARFVTVVTSRKTQYGLSAEKTLIVPAMVRYEVDLAKLTQEDVRWDAGTRTLSVALPPVELSGPEFDLGQTRDYGEGAMLMALTDVERLLDAENRGKAKADVLKQAAGETPLRLARDATARAVERSFAMPLKAAGVEASVKVEFQS